jgi:hypothetical protein
MRPAESLGKGANGTPITLWHKLERQYPCAADGLSASSSCETACGATLANARVHVELRALRGAQIPGVCTRRLRACEN